jgi:hypothetical protein
VIEGYLNNNNNRNLILSEVDNMKNTFINCKVNSVLGVGGAVYLKITYGAEVKYDLSGASYSGCDALFGKSIFIDAIDLKLSL